MKKDQAVGISNLLESWRNSASAVYDIKKVEPISGTLPNFHQWTNGKQVISGYYVTRRNTDTSYFFLFIDWHRNENYYLVIYSHDKKTTLAELHRVEKAEGIPYFIWKYNPLKRDGKNALRKAYFKNAFGSTSIQIKYPLSVFDMEGFFHQLFLLCQNRTRADKIVDLFDFQH